MSYERRLPAWHWRAATPGNLCVTQDRAGWYSMGVSILATNIITSLRWVQEKLIPVKFEVTSNNSLLAHVVPPVGPVHTAQYSGADLTFHYTGTRYSISTAPKFTS